MILQLLMVLLSKLNLRFSALSLILHAILKYGCQGGHSHFSCVAISENVTRVMVYICTKFHASTYKPTILPHIYCTTR